MNAHLAQTANAAPEDEEKLITAPEAARILRCYLSTVYRWINSGKLPAFRRGGAEGRYLMRPADVRALLQPVRPVVLPADSESPRAQKHRAASERWTADVLKKAGFDHP